MEWARLLSIVAHELRSPTAVISGYARMLAEGRVPEGDRAETLWRIERAADRLVVTSQQAADLARWLTARADAPVQALSVDSLLARALAGAEASGRLATEIDAEARRVSVRALDREALAAAVGCVVDTVTREIVDDQVQIVARAVPAPPACDLLVGPSALLGHPETRGGPDAADALSLEHRASGLAFALAVTIIRAHDGHLWTGGDSRNIIGIRLLAGP
jgi:signal transduction histidine kinase